MGWRKNPDTCELEPWEPDYLANYNQIEWLDSLNWKLLALSVTAYFSFFLFVSPAYAITGVELDALVPKIIMAESSGNPHAVGPDGERGLMQITREKWEQFSAYSWDEAFDGDKNVQVGRAILEHIAEVQGNAATVKTVTLSYNTGLYHRTHIPVWALKHRNRIYRSIFNDEKGV